MEEDELTLSPDAYWFCPATRLPIQPYPIETLTQGVSPRRRFRGERVLRENGGMTGLDLVEARREDLVSLCRKYAVRRLRLFGSAVRGKFDPATSDLDFLVEFHPPVGMNAFHQFIDLKLDLEGLFARRVDLVTWRAVKDPLFRARAEETAIELYAA